MIDIKHYYKSPLGDFTQFGEDALTVTVSKVEEHPIHFHDCLEIVFVISGTVNLKYSYEHFDIRENEFAIINAFDLHALKKVTPTAEIAYIHFNDKLSLNNSELVAWRVDDLKRDANTYNALIDNIRQIISEMIFRSGDSQKANVYAMRIGRIIASSLKLASYPQIMQDANEQPNEESTDRIDAIFDYIYRHIDEKIKLDDVAKELAISRYHLSHYIKSHMGFSFTAMLNLSRVERAELLVLDENIMMSDIISKVGFSSYQYFSKCFDQYFGSSPAQYRKKYSRETIAHKAFREEFITMQESGIERKIQEITAGNQVIVDLDSDDYEMTVLESREDRVTAQKYEIARYRKRIVEFDDNDEVVLVIKRKKQP